MTKIFIGSSTARVKSTTLENELIDLINEEDYISEDDKRSRNITLVYESGNLVAKPVERLATKYGYKTLIIGDEVYQGTFDAGLFFIPEGIDVNEEFCIGKYVSKCYIFNAVQI